MHTVFRQTSLALAVLSILGSLPKTAQAQESDPSAEAIYVFPGGVAIHCLTVTKPDWAQRWHCSIARIATCPLALTLFTAN